MKIEEVVYPEEIKPFITSLTDKTKVKSSTFGYLDINIESKDEYFWLIIITWISNTNEILKGLGIIINDIEHFPSNFNAHRYGSIATRFELLIRMFFQEFYRLRELNSIVLGALVKQGVIDKTVSNQVKQTFHDTFKEVINIRNKMVHDKIEWESQDCQLLTMYDLLAERGLEIQHIDSGKKLDISSVLKKRGSEFLPLMIASTEAARDFVHTFSQMTCTVYKNFNEHDK